MNGRLLAVLAVLFAVLCSHDTGSGIDSDAGITATIHEPDGKTPAAWATVKLFYAVAANDKPLAVALTDDHGRYSFTNLAPGIYGIRAEKDSLVLWQDSVEVAATRRTLDDAALEYPSSITGIAGVEYQHEPATITIRAAGTGKTFGVSEEGHFTLTGCASGKCLLLLESSLPGYLPTPVEIAVAPHSNVTLVDTLRVVYTGIPVVSGIRASQDTLAGTILISWNKTACRNFRDYVIYKDACGAINLLPEPLHATADTFFIDSMFAPLVAHPFDTLARCLKYRVAVRTMAQTTGSTNGLLEVRAAPKFHAYTFFTNRMRCEGNRFDSVSINDTVVFTVIAKNRTRPLRKLTWFDYATNKTIPGATVSDSGKKELTDSLRWGFPDTGVHYFYAIITDDAGREWYDEMVVKTVIDTLAAEAGHDTGVFVNEKVYLHGSAFHRFGTIPMWRWKIGDGEWNTADSDTVVTAPSTEQTVLCSLSITDEDGKTSIDTVKFTTSFKVQSIAANGSQSLMLKTDGGLWACGCNVYGQLGDGTVINRPIPVRIMSGVRGMAAGDYHTLLLTEDGDLWACGNNANGQFGDGTAEGRVTPGRVMSDVQSIAAGAYFSLILKTDETLWACGWNPSGRTVNLTAGNRFMPVLMMTDVRGMAAGYLHSLILKTDGTLWTCGNNVEGQLGDGTATTRDMPVQVMSDVGCMAAGVNHSLAVKTDGTLWTFGRNWEAQLGDGTNNGSNVPRQVMSDVRSVAAGKEHSLILKTDGTLWACGYNVYGQLNDSMPVYIKTPVQIMDEVQEIAAGEEHTLILKTDGTVWACGRDESGQLGNGTGVDRWRMARMVPFHYYTSDKESR